MFISPFLIHIMGHLYDPAKTNAWIPVRCNTVYIITDNLEPRLFRYKELPSGIKLQCVIHQTVFDFDLVMKMNLNLEKGLLFRLIKKLLLYENRTPRKKSCHEKRFLLQGLF